MIATGQIATLRVWLLAFLGSILAAQLEIKIFGSWVQVQELWDGQVIPTLSLLTSHPFMPRYLVVYPGFLLEEMFRGSGFSWYISAFFAANLVLLNRVSESAIGRRPGILLVAVFISIHLAMNGRGVIAWSAWLMACSICLESTCSSGLGRRTLLVFPCVLLASVSTGVFVVTVVALAVFLYKQLSPFSGRFFRMTVALKLLLVSPLLFGLISFFYIAIDKNLNFYGGGLSGALAMLDHGVGAVASVSPMDLITVIALVLLGVIAVRLVGNRLRLNPLEKLIAISAVGGLFGLTVLTLAITPIMLRIRRTFVGSRTLQSSLLKIL